LRDSVIVIVCLMLLLAGPSTSAWATGSATDGAFAERVDSARGPLRLDGTGVLPCCRLARAAFYLPPDAAGRDPLDDVAKRLEIEDFRAIDADRFDPAADMLLRRQLPAERLAALRGLHARYESVEPGDRYALTYVPGLGTELAKNGRSLAVIPGADFASAYFGIWLGEKPVDSGLRAALRGGLPERARN